MKLLLDHDVPNDAAMMLRHHGHEVVCLRHLLPATTPDADVWRRAGADARVMVSCNRAHFLALAAATENHPGLIVLIRRRTRQAECAHLLALLRRAGESGLAGNVNFA